MLFSRAAGVAMRADPPSEHSGGKLGHHEAFAGAWVASNKASLLLSAMALGECASRLPAH